jgi:maltose O-acetyltransferase
MVAATSTRELAVFTPKLNRIAARRFIVQLGSNMIPPTGCYALTRRLWRWAQIDVHETSRIVSSARFIGGGRVAIGAHAFISHEVMVFAAGADVTIDSYAAIGPRVYIGTGTHDIDMTGARSAGTGYVSAIHIETGAWIGAGALVLPGVTIGERAVIAAGSVVTNDIPPMVVAAGVPCTVRKRWDSATASWYRD